MSEKSDYMRGYKDGVNDMTDALIYNMLPYYDDFNIVAENLIKDKETEND